MIEVVLSESSERPVLTMTWIVLGWLLVAVLKLILQAKLALTAEQAREQLNGM